LVIRDSDIPLLQLHTTVLFRRLQHLELTCSHNQEIPILPYLEQIESLEIWRGTIPEYSLNLDLPLTRTLQCLRLLRSTSSWMFGRTFKVLKTFLNHRPLFAPEDFSKCEGLQVDLPACTTLELENCPMDYLRFLSCSNDQTLRWTQFTEWTTFNLQAVNPLHDFLFTLSCLQNLDIVVPQTLGIDSLLHVVLCEASEKGVWRDIKCVEVKVWFNTSSEASHFFDQTVGHQQRYEKSWKTFTITKDVRPSCYVQVNVST